MEKIDRIIFGDNQFFGINHMSEEKAQQLAEKFYDIRNIYNVYDIAFANGIKAVMLTSKRDMRILQAKQIEIWRYCMVSLNSLST